MYAYIYICMYVSEPLSVVGSGSGYDTIQLTIDNQVLDDARAGVTSRRVTRGANFVQWWVGGK